MKIVELLKREISLKTFLCSVLWQYNKFSLISVERVRGSQQCLQKNKKRVDYLQLFFRKVQKSRFSFKALETIFPFFKPFIVQFRPFRYSPVNWGQLKRLRHLSYRFIFSLQNPVIDWTRVYFKSNVKSIWSMKHVS